MLFKGQVKKCTVTFKCSKINSKENDRLLWKWEQTQHMYVKTLIVGAHFCHTGIRFSLSVSVLSLSWLKWKPDSQLVTCHCWYTFLCVQSVCVCPFYMTFSFNPDCRPTEKNYVRESHQSFTEHRLLSTLLKYWTSIDFLQNTRKHKSHPYENMLLFRCTWQPPLWGVRDTAFHWSGFKLISRIPSEFCRPCEWRGHRAYKSTI